MKYTIHVPEESINNKVRTISTYTADLIFNSEYIAVFRYKDKHGNLRTYCKNKERWKHDVIDTGKVRGIYKRNFDKVR